MSLPPRDPHGPASSTRHTRWRRLVPLPVIALFVVLLLYPFTLLGRALYWGDLFLYFYPLQQVISDSLRAGRLPLWNPYINCGQPLIGNPQSAIYYPAQLLAPMLPGWLFLTLNMTVHLILAGWFTYLYLRRVCGDRMAALLGAIVYAGSGFLVARLQFPPMVQSAAYLPAVLLAVDRLIEKARARDAALLAVAVALEILAAHTQIAYMTFACATFYALGRLYQIRRHRRRAWRAFRLMFTALLVGVMLCMIHVLPAVQLFVLSNRERLTYKEANRFVFLQDNLVNFLLPDFYGTPANATYWGEGNAWEPYVYVGILPLGLAVVAVIRAYRRRAVRFFAVLGILALWLAMGRFGGLYFLAYYLVPGVAAFHDPARFVFLTTFSIAVLAAVGLRALADLRVWPAARVAVLLLVVLNIWIYNSRLNPGVQPAALMHAPLVRPGVRFGRGRLYTASDLLVWRRYISYEDYGPSTPRYVRELTDSEIPNIAMRFGMEEASGYEPVGVKATTDVQELVDWAFLRRSPNLGRLLGLFDAAAVNLPLGFRYAHPALKEAPGPGAKVLAVREPMPRSWLVRRTIDVPDGRRALAVLGAPDFDPRSIAVVSGGEAVVDEPMDTSSGGLVPVTMHAGTPHRWIDTLDAGPRSALLVWSSTYYPGWTARLDGRPLPLVRANNAFIGAVVPAGRHRVDFDFRPFVFRLGEYLSFAASAVVAFGLVQGGQTGRSTARIAAR